MNNESLPELVERLRHYAGNDELNRTMRQMDEWMAADRLERLSRAMKRLLDNINEFGQVTDEEILDSAAIAMEARQGGDGTAPSRSDDSAARRDRPERTSA